MVADDRDISDVHQVRGVLIELWTDRDEREIEEFLAAVSRDDLASALFAIEGADRLTADADRATLKTWSRRTRERVFESASPIPRPWEQAKALGDVLGQELGFRGDQEDYYHPKNSLLHRVMARRRGMPILLSTVWMLVAQEAGIPAAGVGIPGHFVVRVGFPGGILVDPFAGGAQVSVPECRRRFEQMTDGKSEWQDEFLRPSTLDQIAERVLQNLLVSYKRLENGRGQYRAAAFLAALRPDSPERLWQKAEVAGAVGAYDLAERSLKDIVNRFPDSQESEWAAGRLDEPSRETVN